MRYVIPALVLLATGCTAGGYGTQWTSDSNAVLQDGIALRGSYDPMICPCAPDGE